MPRVRDIRRFGSAALDLAWTAAGRYDAYYERSVKQWDIAAGALVCERAGLQVHELPAHENLPWGILVAPPALAAPLLGSSPGLSPRAGAPCAPAFAGPPAPTARWLAVAQRRQRRLVQPALDRAERGGSFAASAVASSIARGSTRSASTASSTIPAACASEPP